MSEKKYSFIDVISLLICCCFGLLTIGVSCYRLFESRLPLVLELFFILASLFFIVVSIFNLVKGDKKWKKAYIFGFFIFFPILCYRYYIEYQNYIHLVYEYSDFVVLLGKSKFYLLSLSGMLFVQCANIVRVIKKLA